MLSHEKIKIFYEQYCHNNNDFLNKIFNNNIYNKNIQTDIIDNNNIINDDLYEEKNLNTLISKYIDNKLITTRFGCVESKFIVQYHFNKYITDHNNTFDNIDINMRMNAGLYYKDNKNKDKVLKWWNDNSIEILHNSVLTSCLLFLNYDLILWSSLNFKSEYYNWGYLHKIILKNSENKKILYIGNNIDSINYAYNRGIQNAWNFHIPKFFLNCLKTPQTTLNMDYPDETMIETTEKIIEEIELKYNDFDTALLACGAYGPPIMNILRKKYNNKNLIYMGSDIFKMFGIYSHIMPIPDDTDINKSGWIEIIEKCDPRCRNIDNGKYWKI